MSDLISIRVGDADYSGWKAVSVGRSLEALAGRFTMTTVDRWALGDEAWTLFPERACRIDIGQDTILEGYIDAVSPSISAGAHAITVTGRDKTADLVDCSAPDDPGKWNNLTLLGLAQAMADPFGISVSTDVALGGRFSTFKIKSGETIFTALSRAAQKRHVLLASGRVGNLLITNAGTVAATDRLVMGQNVVRAVGSYDYTNRFGSYLVRGQDRTAGKGWGASTIKVRGEADDEEILRHRPKILRGDGITTTKSAQNQARWEANVRAAKSFRATVGVVGFRQSSGDLWEMNQIVDVDVPELLLAGSMLVSAIEYQQSNDGGSTASLELTRPDAYVEEPPKTVKKVRNLGW